MQQSELSELLAQIAQVKQRDFQVGVVLETIAQHLGSACGLEVGMAQAALQGQPSEADKAAKQTKSGG